MGRPKGSKRQEQFRQHVAAGIDPLEAAKRAGFADPHRAVARLGKLKPEVRAVAAEAHAQIAMHEATVLSGSTMGAIQRLTSIIAFGEDKDAVSAARALNTIAPEVEQKDHSARYVFVTYDNQRGPGHLHENSQGDRSVNASGDFGHPILVIHGDMPPTAQVVDWLAGATDRSLHVVFASLPEPPPTAAPTAPEPVPQPTAAEPPKHKPARVIVPPKPEQPSSAPELLKRYGVHK